MSTTNCLPFTDFNPDTKALPVFLPKIGFRPLNNATPADLPVGSLVVLYNVNTFCFDTVIVRDLENGIFFYSHQTGRSQDSWYNALFGDSICNGYLFKVIS